MLDLVFAYEDGDGKMGVQWAEQLEHLSGACVEEDRSNDHAMFCDPLAHIEALCPASLCHSLSPN